MLEVRQGVGDAIFVPSGWHHTVENLEGQLLALLSFPATLC